MTQYKLGDRMLSVTVETEGLNPEERGLIYAASNHAEKALNSDEFRVFCLNFKFSKKIKNIFGKTRVKECSYFHMAETTTRSEVYRKIMAGAEKLDPVEDENAEIYLKVDRSTAYGVVGYTRASTKWQWIYSWVLKKYTIEQIAGNLIHEYCHKLGFPHEKKKTTYRKYSVPYAIGYFVRDYI